MKHRLARIVVWIIAALIILSGLQGLADRLTDPCPNGYITEWYSPDHSSYGCVVDPWYQEDLDTHLR